MAKNGSTKVNEQNRRKAKDRARFHLEVSHVVPATGRGQDDGPREGTNP